MAARLLCLDGQGSLIYLFPNTQFQNSCGLTRNTILLLLSMFPVAGLVISLTSMLSRRRITLLSHLSKFYCNADRGKFSEHLAFCIQFNSDK